MFKEYNTVIWVDCETTGLNPATDFITELGAVITHPFKTKEEIFDSLIRVPVQIPARITELTGITQEMCDRAASESTVISEFMSKIEGKTLIIGHNLNFDLAFINAAFERNGFKLPDCDFLDTLTVLSDRKIGGHRLCDGITFYKLEELCKNSHRASDDAFACKMLTSAMYEEKEDLDEYINYFKYKTKYNPNGPSYRNDRILYIAC